MRVMVNNAKGPGDTPPTFAEKLTGMLREVWLPADAKKGNGITDKEWPVLVMELEKALDEAKQKANSANARATAQAQAKGVKTQADAAVKDAQKATEPAPM
jgi:hypothetical protein